MLKFILNGEIYLFLHHRFGSCCFSLAFACHSGKMVIVAAPPQGDIASIYKIRICDDQD